ncbi:hypothetical protein SBA4_3550028 [Candidatus Sulfopaludibacter sp. SbA4]|nr:hypothetical protein SBA4_3550028 [Candidatus Sulfopaludibacter sp. SbA4]
MHRRSARRVEHTGQYKIGSPSSLRVTASDSDSFTDEKIIPPASRRPIPYNRNQSI